MALSKYAHEEAIHRFRQGLAAKEGMPIDDDTADLEYGLGQALGWGGKMGESSSWNDT